MVGLGKGNLVGAVGTGAVADSGVVRGKGRPRARALSPRFSQGSKSRDRVGSRAKAGGVGLLVRMTRWHQAASWGYRSLSVWFMS